MKSTRDRYWQKLKIVYNALLKPERWYTGLTIKQYLRQNVFNLDSNFDNKPIGAGRWSAYAHYSLKSAFQNLLEKHDIDQTKTVLVHPLLPAELVDLILARGAKLATMDIQKTTLSMDASELLNYIRLMKSTGLPDLVVQYDMTGLLKEVIQSANDLQKLTIPTLVFVDNPQIHSDFLELCKQLQFGSVLWNAGQSFLDEQLDAVVNTKIESQSWYYSWFLETRSRSVLEYHLRDSQDIFRPFLEAYFFLLLKKYEELDFKARFVFTPIGNRLFLKNSFESKSQAEAQLLSNYEKLQEVAISDVIFDLQLKSIEAFEIAKVEDVYHQELFWRQKSKQLYDYFLQQIQILPPGTLEVPDFYLDKTYIWQYIFTTDQSTLNKHFSDRGWQVDTKPMIHPSLAIRPKLTNALLVSKYGFGLNVALSGENKID